MVCGIKHLKYLWHYLVWKYHNKKSSVASLKNLDQMILGIFLKRALKFHPHYFLKVSRNSKTTKMSLHKVHSFFFIFLIIKIRNNCDFEFKKPMLPLIYPCKVAVISDFEFLSKKKNALLKILFWHFRCFWILRHL